MIYAKLFWSFFQIGLFSIGGGYAALPLIQSQIVDVNQWLTFAEFTDLIAIAEMTPGPIAINASTFVGIQTAGFGGAAAATLGCVTPSCIIVTLLAYLYFKYNGLTVIKGVLGALRPVAAALIASAGVSIALLALFGERGFALGAMPELVPTAVFGFALAVIRRFKPNPVYIILICGVLGGVIYSV